MTEDGATKWAIMRNSDLYKYQYDNGTDTFYLLPDDDVGDDLIGGGLSGPEQTACDALKTELWDRMATEGMELEAYSACS